MAEISNEQILKALIRGLKGLVALLEKVRRGEPV